MQSNYCLYCDFTFAFFVTLLLCCGVVLQVGMLLSCNLATSSGKNNLQLTQLRIVTCSSNLVHMKGKVIFHIVKSDNSKKEKLFFNVVASKSNYQRQPASKILKFLYISHPGMGVNSLTSLHPQPLSH